jgi:hypothetical protein
MTAARFLPSRARSSHRMHAAENRVLEYIKRVGDLYLHIGFAR